LEIKEALKITIITVCKNSGRFLEETINSVIRQTYQNIQYIVIDGNSTDDTVSIIKRYSANIDTWLSEADEGMYYAINKGLKIATGDYILILNSDDVLVADDTIKNIVEKINKKRLDYYHGNMIKSKDGKSKKVKLFSVTFKSLLLSTHSTFVPHPCFFISNKYNRLLGGYNQNYKYASDYDYILRALDGKENKGEHLDIYVSNFRIHDNSISASGKIDAERKIIITEHGYYQIPRVSREITYYVLWIYYKMINLGHTYKTG
jgi:glycosyltransferase involved in cell wall biosynthesis